MQPRRLCKRRWLPKEISRSLKACHDRGRDVGVPMRTIPGLCSIAILVAGWLVLPAHGAPGDHFDVQPGDLPAPNTTFPEGLTPSFDPPPPGSAPRVPAGFVISEFASHQGYIRTLAVAPEGDVFVVRPEGDVLRMRDTKNAGRADKIDVFTAGFKGPHGIAIRDGQLYISDS